MNEKNIEVWLRMYEEQVRHGRHHEVMRSQATNIVVVVSAALLAFITTDISAGHLCLAAIFLLILNIYGLFMSLKHYERSRLHVTVAGKYRDEISKISVLESLSLNEARANGKAKHKPNFPFISNMRGYVLWSGLHLLIAALAIAVLLLEQSCLIQ